MTFPNSGLFVATFVDALDTTQLALDLDLETHKAALYTNSVVAPDLTVDTAYGVSPWNANEIPNGSGYTTGGKLCTTTVYVHTSGGVVKFDCDDITWTTATITARGALYYADALAGNNSFFAQNFGADIVSTAGDFVIQQHASGLWTVDYVP